MSGQSRHLTKGIPRPYNTIWTVAPYDLIGRWGRRFWMDFHLDWFDRKSETEQHALLRRWYITQRRFRLPVVPWYQEKIVKFRESPMLPYAASTVWHSRHVNKGYLTMSGPSAHLTWKELACKDGSPYPVEWRATRLPALVEVFERLRVLCGNTPLTVLSAYRTEAHNRRVGGARLSQHVQGRALDIRCPTHMTLREFTLIAKSMRSEPGNRLRGLGVYPDFLHVDVRPAERLITWYGSRHLADLVV